MSDQIGLEELMESEIAFWQEFISRWQRERQDPVPHRAWDALAHAKDKLQELTVNLPDQHSVH